MSEHEPTQDKIDFLARAAKLREMIQTAGWQEVFEPRMRADIEMHKRQVLETTCQDVREYWLNQQLLKFKDELLTYVQMMVATADEMIKAEAAEQQSQQGTDNQESP